jgi:ribosomal 50S subunit-associated protein YjgA (DUF615 family)
MTDDESGARLDRIQTLAEQLAKVRHNGLRQMELATRIREEISAAKRASSTAAPTDGDQRIAQIGIPTGRELVTAHLKQIRELANELVRWQGAPGEQLRISERIRRVVSEATIAMNRVPK